MDPPKSKKTEGHKKIEMKFIEDKNARSVTLSKRRSGIFKKATELSILCGVQIGVIIFSICGKAYTFGHPSIESLIARFLNRNPVPTMQDSVEGRMIQAATVMHLKEQCEEAQEKLDNEKRKAKELESALESSPYYVTEEKLSKMSMGELKELKERMVALRKKLAATANSETGAKGVVPEDRDKTADLARVESDGHGASPIPSDWLKL